MRAELRTLRVDAFSAGEQFREYFAAWYGPTIAAYRNVADDPERTAALDRAIVAVADEHLDTDGVMQWQYLLVVADRA